MVLLVCMDSESRHSSSLQMSEGDSLTTCSNEEVEASIICMQRKKMIHNPSSSSLELHLSTPMSALHPSTPMSASPLETLNPSPKPNDSWTIVSNRRNRKQSKTKPESNLSAIRTLTLKSPVPWSPLDPQTNPTLQSKLRTKIQSSLSKIKSSQFFAQFITQLNSPQIQSGLDNLLSFSPQFELIIYGIGSIDSHEAPRLQLSLALLIYEHLRPKILSVEVFDPIISTTEHAIIEELGLRVMSIDEQARREIKVPTLFFMPHCEVQLYDNLLESNWGRESLKRMVILGNSFAEYERYVEENRGLNGSVKVEEVGRKVIGSRRFVREVGVKGCEDSGDGFFRAFHDTSWHFFDVCSDIDMNFT